MTANPTAYLTTKKPSAIPTSLPTTFPSDNPTTSKPTVVNHTANPTTTKPIAFPSTRPPTAPPTSSRPTQYDDQVILLTDLLSKIRAEFQKLITPDTTGTFALNVFNVIRPAGAICEGSDRALSIDIDRDGISTLNLTICALLEFELEGPFVSTGLVSAIEDSIQVDISGSFMLKGALMFGARLIVQKNNSTYCNCDNRIRSYLHGIFCRQ